MAKVIIFSRVFPSYHPKKGEPTYFIEKFLKGCPDQITPIWRSEENRVKLLQLELRKWNDFHPKYHTIRAGNRFKPGDYFSPRVWYGKPYKSKQMTIGADTLIVKTYDFEIDLNGVYSIDGKYIDEETYPVLAMNDGLTEEDMQFWFMPNYDKPKEFHGQIIIWNDIVNY